VAQWVAGALCGVLILSFLGTGFVRHIARRRKILDIPNRRSSHEAPTPRGGGIVLALLFLFAVTGLLVAGVASRRLWIALLGGGAVVAAVGWLDDCRRLSSALRLLLYALAAAWSSVWIGGLPTLSLGFAGIEFGWGGYLLAWAVILGLTNIYNFMDGIDGLAGGEAVAVGAGAGAVLVFSGQPYLGWLLIGLAVAVLGFLPWNWSPARIFMGDSGSNFLGFAFASCAIASEAAVPGSAWIWALLLAVFVVDGLLTFGRRLIRRLSPRVAHRSHAYQGALLKGFSHGAVSTAVMVINFGLIGLAVLVWNLPVAAIPLVVAIYCALGFLHFRYSPLGRNPEE